MVIHDKEQEQRWVERRHKQNDKKELTISPTSCRLSVVAIQSLACIALLLVVFLLRVAGGSAYTGLQQRFSDALAGNELMAVWMQRWDTGVIAAIDDVKQDDFTSELSLE